MTSIRRVLLAATIASLVLAGCGSDDDDSASSDNTATTAEATATTADAYRGMGVTSTTGAAAGAATIATASTSRGTVLVDGEGRTLYMFTRDSENKSTCSGACEQTWPPVFAQSVNAGAGVDSGKLGTTTSREGGQAQATYNSHPLYRFSGDTKAGDTNGQGVGGTWFVVSPSGDPVR